MANCRKANGTRTAIRLGWGGAAVVCCLLTFTAGCSTTKKSQGDPLVGEIHPSQNAGAPVPPNPPAHTKNPGVPPVPSTQAPASSAALAALDGRRSLAIGGGSNPANSAQPANFVPTMPTASGTSSGGPRVMPLPRDNAPPPVLTTGSFTASQQTSDLLQAQLRERGVMLQKQEAVADGVKFTCIVPVAGNPDRTQFYEATARDYASAVQAVLVQIDQQRK